MLKALVVKEKHGTRVFDISTEELKQKAYLTLFKERKKAGYYSDVIWMESQVFDRAMKGSGKDAERLIKQRRDYEYEFTEEVGVE